MLCWLPYWSLRACRAYGVDLGALRRSACAVAEPVLVALPACRILSAPVLSRWRRRGAPAAGAVQAHLCLVFELLSVNLYELVKHNQFRGLSMNLLRLFMTQVRNPSPPCRVPFSLPGSCEICFHLRQRWRRGVKNNDDIFQMSILITTNAGRTRTCGWSLVE